MRSMTTKTEAPDCSAGFHSHMDEEFGDSTLNSGVFASLSSVYTKSYQEIIRSTAYKVLATLVEVGTRRAAVLVLAGGVSASTTAVSVMTAEAQVDI
jgi:hypothetical protein